MPYKSRVPCKYPGCGKLIQPGTMYCDEHAALRNSQYEKYGRDKDTKRRYGRAWKRIRDKYAAEHPFCEQSYAKGVLVPTEEIHHKLPLSEGGTHNRSNLIALCKSCHSQDPCEAWRSLARTEVAVMRRMIVAVLAVVLSCSLLCCAHNDSSGHEYRDKCEWWRED